MMRKTYRFPAAVRHLWLLTVALQMILPGAAVWGDARLATQASGAVVHVEAGTTPECASVHPADCGLCRYLTTPGCGECASPTPGVAPSPDGAPATAGVGSRAGTYHALPHARAPPPHS